MHEHGTEPHCRGFPPPVKTADLKEAFADVLGKTCRGQMGTTFLAESFALSPDGSVVSHHYAGELTTVGTPLTPAGTFTLTAGTDGYPGMIREHGYRTYFLPKDGSTLAVRAIPEGGWRVYQATFSCEPAVPGPVLAAK